MATGYKSFTAGAVLAAADVKDYLMLQTVQTFATSAARDSALSGVLREGLLAYTSDLDTHWYYNGSAWRKILSPFTAFTPAWSNLTPGTSAVDASYRYVGNCIEVYMSITFAAGSSVGTNPVFTIPDAQTALKDAAGSIRLSDASAGQVFTGTMFVGATGTVIGLCSASGWLTATSPFTWATSDIIGGSIMIRVV